MIAVIDYGAGNLYSVAKALMKVSGDNVVITKEADDINKAERLVLPGVGAFSHCYKVLQESKLINVITKAAFEDKKPMLAICIGMQLMAKCSYEYEKCEGLGWFDAEVVPFEENLPENSSLRVPHTGWNNVNLKQNSFLFNGISDDSAFYFNHSYFLKFLKDEKSCIAKTNYGIDFVSAIEKNNIFACQFHPEKSQSMGIQMLKNFCQWQPNNHKGNDQRLCCIRE